MIKRLFTPPVFEKDNDNFRARFIHGFAWITITVLSLYILGVGIRLTNAFLLGVVVAQIVSLFLLYRKHIDISAWIQVILIWIAITYQAYNAAGARDIVIVTYLGLAILAGIVIGLSAGGAVIVASIASIWVLTLLEVNQVIIPNLETPFEFARDLTFAFIVVTILIYLSTTNLTNALKRANKSEDSLRGTNQKLQALNQNLEDRVTSRTQELEQANQHNERRARQFEAIAQVAHATISNQDIETMLNTLVKVVAEKFDFYHAGIFLLDDNQEYAVLRAANSSGGKRMLERKHKLKLGQSGIVGFVTASGKPRIALDVGDDAVYFNNPDLPDTRSEMALPLIIDDETIGALDIQSTESNAFHEEDIEVLSTLADQVAIAIQNAHSYETSQRLLAEAQKASGAYLRDSWHVLDSENKNFGYRLSDNGLTPLEHPLTSFHVQKAISNHETVKESGTTATLAVPIRLRGDTIGVIDIRVPQEHEWEQDEVDITEAIAERLSLALESATLLRSTRRRAEIERATAEISGKISSSTQFDAILKTAAEELSRVFGGSEVLVQVTPTEATEED